MSAKDLSDKNLNKEVLKAMKKYMVGYIPLLIFTLVLSFVAVALSQNGTNGSAHYSTLYMVATFLVLFLVVAVLLIVISFWLAKDTIKKVRFAEATNDHLLGAIRSFYAVRPGNALGANAGQGVLTFYKGKVTFSPVRNFKPDRKKPTITVDADQVTEFTCQPSSTALYAAAQGPRASFLADGQTYNFSNIRGDVKVIVGAAGKAGIKYRA